MGYKVQWLNGCDYNNQDRNIENLSTIMKISHFKNSGKTST